MYRLLTGELPFVDRSPAVLMRRQIHDTPRPLRERVCDLPATIEAVVLRTLAKRPEDRYQSARELARAIRGACELAEFDLAEIVAEDIPSRPPPRQESRRALNFGAAGLALVIAALLAHALVGRGDGPATPHRTPPPQQLSPGSGPVRPVLSTLSLQTASEPTAPILAAVDAAADRSKAAGLDAARGQCRAPDASAAPAAGPRPLW